MDLVFHAARAVTPDGERSCSVGVSDGRVAAVDDYGALSGDRVVELREDEVLLPGLVDTHVHVNDPGRSDWEGFDTATRAAAAGGVTTIVDMPLNCLPPTVDVASLDVKRRAAEGRIAVDVGFWGGAVPGNRGELRPLHDAGVFGFKCFLLHSGVDEFAPLDETGLEEAMRELAEFDGLLIVHAEDADTIEGAPAAHGRAYTDFLGSRPSAAENTAIARVLDLARRTGARVHILHLAAGDAVPLVAQARADGVRVTAETCPHYLSFVAEEIRDGATEFKCCPPIREAGNREELWRALGDGVIDCVVTDHSPCTPELKRFDTGDFGDAWGGIAGLQVGLPAVWTGARSRGFTLDDVVRWMAQRPAEQVGLASKGRIAVGCDADFAVFAPDEAFVVDRTRLRHRNPVSAYHERALAGVVRASWLRGREINLEHGAEPFGEFLSREESAAPVRSGQH
ncbi:MULTISPECIES: allantoinase AllB [Prauserella salsuginis group]|uniref:allantoinase n=1 Tax=Prauserella salsuginis TaxID=387889 RepID=A0ABW6G6E8_9PSEU|nr:MULTISPECIES: allantoinase AllB [Prauserella salsuginis group]MCR3719335.1 allantoinase [Prauserella flava]MCR3735651.1 allantoinase [Prauserella salsuginis]